MNKRIALVTAWMLCSHAAFVSGQDLSFQWDTNRSSVTIEVPEKTAKLLRDIDRPELHTAFYVAVEQATALLSLRLPPVSGSYQWSGNSLSFKAGFPFEPGVTYRASFNYDRVSGTGLFRIPKPEIERTTVVREIYPSSTELPQNLLKFYLHFSSSMSGGHIYENIHLLDENGGTIELPFLEIDEELWNPEMTRLTLFLDPGRIKREVKPLEEVGPALEPGKSYTLRIDASWMDARGAPLIMPYEKHFQVLPPDRDPPNPSRWKVVPPSSGARDPLRIVFSEPMDAALSLRMITVRDSSGHEVTGLKALDANETTWLLTPAMPWSAGRFQLLVQSTIEDLAGNNIGKPFEVDLAEGQQPRLPAKTIRLSFVIN